MSIGLGSVTRARSRRNWGTIARIVAAVIALAAIVSFTLQNAEPVHFRFLMFEVSTSLAVALIVTGLVGFFLGLLAPRIIRLF